MFYVDVLALVMAGPLTYFIQPEVWNIQYTVVTHCTEICNSVCCICFQLILQIVNQSLRQPIVSFESGTWVMFYAAGSPNF